MLISLQVMGCPNNMYNSMTKALYIKQKSWNVMIKAMCVTCDATWVTCDMLTVKWHHLKNYMQHTHTLHKKQEKRYICLFFFNSSMSFFVEKKSLTTWEIRNKKKCSFKHWVLSAAWNFNRFPTIFEKVNKKTKTFTQYFSIRINLKQTLKKIVQFGVRSEPLPSRSHPKLIYRHYIKSFSQQQRVTSCVVEL